MSTPIIVLFICLSTILLAQLIKFIITSVVNQRIESDMLISTGGMPSSHSAFVTTLATAIALFEGVESYYFVLSVILALVVIHDAFNIRYEASKHARVINQIRLRLNLIENIEAEEKKLKESLGHRPREVAAGILFGVVTAFLGYLMFGMV